MNVRKPLAPVTAPACPGGAWRATCDNCTPFQPMAVAPKHAHTASSAGVGHPAPKVAVAYAQRAGRDADHRQQRSRRNELVGDGAPADAADDTAEIGDVSAKPAATSE